jgi:HlyD family secretion protein
VAETAAVAEATWRLEQAEAQLANLSKGRRPTELDVVRAQLSQAQASLRLSEAQLQRQEALVSSSVAAVSRLDEARAARDRDRARVGELTAQLASQRLAARDDEIDAARATVETAKAALAQAEWRRGQREVAAPVEALVTDTIYRLGEFVPAGAPVVSLLPRGNVKVRFFIPETVLATIAVGSPFAIECDACPPGIEGRVTFIAPNAEFTPPVIYSRESRSKLVFLVEAKSPGISNLNPGQPVDVRPVRP